jgi:hypothetical protein
MAIAVVAHRVIAVGRRARYAAGGGGGGFGGLGGGGFGGLGGSWGNPFRVMVGPCGGVRPDHPTPAGRHIALHRLLLRAWESGQAPAPPNSDMNSRLLTQSPRRRARVDYRRF